MLFICRLFVLIGLFVNYAQSSGDPPHTVYPCTEAALDRVLADLHDGDTVKFGCSGTIITTSPKRISTTLTVDGSGQAVTISNDGSLPVFQVDMGIGARISHLTFVRNRAEDTGTIDNRGVLFLQDVHFTNTWRGVYNGARASLFVSESTFTGNDIGISNFGSLTVKDSTFTDNRRDGIYSRRELVMIGCTLTGNPHGLDNDHGVVGVTNSTFTGNRVSGGRGAGIANSGQLVVMNSTLAQNWASAGGGAIFNHEGGMVTLRNTILADNGPEGNCSGPVVDGGGNLQYPGVTCGDSIPSADPDLLPLADNGGPTQTMALADGSPAIGAGDVDMCTWAPVDGVDQRGVPRSVPTRCDSGAFETASVPNPYWFKVETTHLN